MPRDAVPAGRPRPAAPQHRPGRRELARGAGVALRPHVKTHKSVEIARLQLAAGAVGHHRGHHRRGRDVRRATASTTSSSPIPLWLDDVSAGRLRDLTGDARVAIGVDSVEGAANAGRLLGGVGRRGAGRGRLRPPPQRGPPGGRRRGRRGGARAPGSRCAASSPSPGTATPRTAPARGRGRRGARPCARRPGRCARPGSSRGWSAAARRRAWRHSDTDVADRAAAGGLRLRRRPAVGAGHDDAGRHRADLPLHRGQPRRRPARARRRQQGARRRPRGVRHRLRPAARRTRTPGSCCSRSTTPSSTSPALPSRRWAAGSTSCPTTSATRSTWSTRCTPRSPASCGPWPVAARGLNA